MAGDSVAARRPAVVNSACAVWMVSPGASRAKTVIAGPERGVLIEDSGLERQPHVVRDRKLEALTHDPDHRGVLVSELHVASEHVWIAAKPRAPHVVANHRHGGRCGLFVGFEPAPGP